MVIDSELLPSTNSCSKYFLDRVKNNKGNIIIFLCVKLNNTQISILMKKHRSVHKKWVSHQQHTPERCFMYLHIYNIDACAS